MAETRPTLPQRVTAILRARQYVVFFAIALYALDVAVPLASAWLYRRGDLSELLEGTRGPLADAVAARSALIAAVLIGYLLLKAYLRAGYVRSLTGPFHLGAAGLRQWARMLGLGVILEVIAAAAAGALVLAGDRTELGGLAVIALLAIYLALMYADYIVVLADVGPIRAIILSWRTVRSALLLSLLVLMTVSLAGDILSLLLTGGAVTSVARAAPMFLVQAAMMGAVLFVADVALVVIYTRAVERGRLTPTRRQPSTSSQE